MEFEITTTKKYNIDCCNDCPFCYCKEDTSVVFDSFDDPNYDYQHYVIYVLKSNFTDHLIKLIKETEDKNGLSILCNNQLKNIT